MFFKKSNFMAENSAKASAKHSQVKKLVQKPAVVEEIKEKGEKDVRNFKRDIQAQISALTDAVKHITDKKQLTKPVETENSDTDNLKRELERLFTLSYHNIHSLRVRLGKLRAKRERIACYYANDCMSEEDYQIWLEYLNWLEDEINGVPPKEANAKKAILLCRTTVKNDIALKAQEKRLNEYCKHKNMQVVATHKIVKSSKDYSVLDAVLDYINTQKGTVALVCDKVDRLIRSKDVYNKVNKLRRDGKLELHFVSENLVLSKESNSNVLLHFGLIVEYAMRLVS